MAKKDQIYCSKCKTHTETENEDWDQERRLLSGDCTDCGKMKVTFVNEKGYFKKKSSKELVTARIQRKERTLNRKAKKLGREILDADKKVQKKVRGLLNEA